MEYTVITSKFGYDLEVMVNARIETGWQPLGGIAIRDDLFAQAMTRPKFNQWAVTATVPNSEPNVVLLNETTVSDAAVEYMWRGV